MGQAQINVRTRACSRTSIARTRQAALTHNVRGKEIMTYLLLCAILLFNFYEINRCSIKSLTVPFEKFRGKIRQNVYCHIIEDTLTFTTQCKWSVSILSMIQNQSMHGFIKTLTDYWIYSQTTYLNTNECNTQWLNEFMRNNYIYIYLMFSDFAARCLRWSLFFLPGLIWLIRIHSERRRTGNVTNPRRNKDVSTAERCEVLPGVHERTLRQSAGDPADRNDSVLPPLTLRYDQEQY